MMTTLTRTGLAVLRDAALGNEPMPPCAELLGWQALELEPGRVRVRYTARQAFCNPQGTIQGGFVAAMLDDAMGPALYTLLDETQFAPTLEMKVSYLRPAMPGALSPKGGSRTEREVSRSSRGRSKTRTGTRSRRLQQPLA